jgi:O-acetylserine/cysteine efflux transporter
MKWHRTTTTLGETTGAGRGTTHGTASPARDFGGDRRAAIVALAAAGTLWGLTVPLSKLGLEWLGAGWLAVARFAIAAPLLALFARRSLRAALTPAVVAAGALGYGLVIVLQNSGIERTSVSHAALIVGAVPVLVASIAAVLGRGSGGRLMWIGSLLALAGVGLVAGGGGAGTSVEGDLLVLLSVTMSAAFIVAQPSLLAGRDPAAVTAVQLGAGGLAALPLAIVLEGAPPAPTGAQPVVAVLALALTGTLLAFWLFAWAQARVPAELAGAFVNLEPLVGALTGAVAFHDVVGPAQLLGGAEIVAGIALGALPRPPKREAASPAPPPRPAEPPPPARSEPPAPRRRLDPRHARRAHTASAQRRRPRVTR